MRSMPGSGALPQWCSCSRGIRATTDTRRRHTPTGFGPPSPLRCSGAASAESTSVRAIHLHPRERSPASKSLPRSERAGAPQHAHTRYDKSGNRTYRRYGAYSSEDDEYTYATGTDIIDSVNGVEMSNSAEGEITEANTPTNLAYTWSTDGELTVANNDFLGDVDSRYTHFHDRYEKSRSATRGRPSTSTVRPAAAGPPISSGSRTRSRAAAQSSRDTCAPTSTSRAGRSRPCTPPAARGRQSDRG